MYEQTLEYRNYTIQIIRDIAPENPRHFFDGGGTIYSEVGIIKNESDWNLASEFDDWNAKKAHIMFNERIHCIMPLYLTGSTIHRGGENVSCEKGTQIGFIYMTKAEFDDLYGGKEWLEKFHKGKTVGEVCREILKHHVEMLHNYYDNEVYGWNLMDPDDRMVTSCWGYYTDCSIIEDAKANIDVHISHKMKSRIRKLKGYIRNKVDIIYRFCDQHLNYY